MWGSCNVGTQVKGGGGLLRRLLAGFPASELPGEVASTPCIAAHLCTDEEEGYLLHLRIEASWSTKTSTRWPLCERRRRRGHFASQVLVSC